MCPTPGRARIPCGHYARRGSLAFPPPAPSTPPPPRWQFGVNRIQGPVNCGGLAAHSGLVGPVFWVQTSGAVQQPVSLLRGARAPANPLDDVVVALPDPGRLRRTQHPAQHRPVIGNRRGRRGRRWRCVARLRTIGGTRWTMWRPALMPIGLIRPRDHRFARNRSPIEAQIRMRVLERFHDLRVERGPADLQIRR